MSELRRIILNQRGMKKIDQIEDEVFNKGTDFAKLDDEIEKNGNEDDSESETHIDKVFETDVNEGVKRSEKRYKKAVIDKFHLKEEEFGIKLEPFSMKEERESSLLDKDGSFRFEKEKGDKDEWFTSLQQDGVKMSRKLQDKLYKNYIQQEKNKSKKKIETIPEIDFDNICKQALELKNLLEDGHHVNRSLVILRKKAGIKKQPKWKKFKKNVRKSQKKNETLSTSKSAPNSKEKEYNLKIDTISTLCNSLMNAGMIQIYTTKKEDIIPSLQKFMKKKKSFKRIDKLLGKRETQEEENKKMMGGVMMNSSDEEEEEESTEKKEEIEDFRKMANGDFGGNSKIIKMAGLGRNTDNLRSQQLFARPNPMNEDDRLEKLAKKHKKKEVVSDDEDSDNDMF